MNKIGEWTSKNWFRIREPNVVIRLSARLVLDDAEEDLQSIANKVSKALGIVLGDDTEGYYEELNAFISVTLDQLCALYQEPAESLEGSAGKIILEVRPHADPLWMGMVDYTFVQADISHHIAALLWKKAGLRFT